MNRFTTRAVAVTLLAFALIFTGMALFYLILGNITSICKGPDCLGFRTVLPELSHLSDGLAIIFWFAFAFSLTFWREQPLRSDWKKAGLDKGVYDLMMQMRGGNSRLQLLRNLQSPKQRNELSQITGIDWKEVDRQINLLLSYGLVSIFVETGSVKVYRLTEQGQLLLKLMGELNG